MQNALVDGKGRLDTRQRASKLKCIHVLPIYKSFSSLGSRDVDCQSLLQEPCNMANMLSLYVFGDQDGQFRDNLGVLLLTGGNPTLNTFFDKVALLLRQEIQTLSWSQREQFPSFCNILDLLAIDATKPFHPALQLALSSVHHFAVSLR